MASIARDPNGTKRILFIDRNRNRRTVRLGRMSVKAAEGFKLRIEALNAARTAGTAIDSDLAAWVRDLGDVMHERLVRVELVEPRAAAAAVTLSGLLAAFFDGLDVKPATLVRMRQAEAALLGYFNPGRDVATITAADADGWRAQLKADGYAAATISRTVRYARQVFRWGIKRGMVAGNPFADLKAGSQTNQARAVFIDRETIAKVIDAAPDAEWRLLIALSRFGGLRVPSEALALRWSDVDWANNRMTVRSSKTEHHEGRGERIVPIFPEIREPLLAVFEQAPEGAEHVIGRYREGCNLNPHFRRIIRRAGLTPWPRTWHNLRASRQTELAATYPLHTVCSWIGNTKAIAAGHYLQVTDADWTRATGTAPEVGAESGAECGAREAQNAAQHPTALGRAGTPKPPKIPCFAGVSRPNAPDRTPMRAGANSPLMGRGGLEPPTPAFSVRCSTN